MDWPGLGLHLLGWHKQKVGWLGPADLVCVNGAATATLSPIEDPGGMKMLVSKTAPGVAYVAEVHSPTGYDSELSDCDDGGVLIYRINADGGNAFANGIAPITVRSATPPDPSDASGKCVALSNATFGFGPGEVSSFSEGGVTVQVLSGSPGGEYSVRMTGPNPNPPSAAPGKSARAAALAKCKKKRSAKARKKCRRKANKLPLSRERLLLP
jgi:hypothetical protein